MNNQIQIDLSKAYAGQIVTFRNGETDTVLTVFGALKPSKCFVLLGKHRHPLAQGYNYNGLSDSRKSKEWDIIALSDPIQVQAARIEGEIKGLEWAISIISNAHDKMCIIQAIEDLKDQLSNIQNSQ